MFQNTGGNDLGGGFGGGGGFAPGGGFGGAAGGDRQKKFRYQNITPVTASNIKEMTFDDSVFRLGDHEVSQVTVVGTVIQVEKTQTCHTYKIDDTTGTVTAKHWVSVEGDEDDMECEEPVYEEGTPIRIFAQIRSFQKKVTLNALHVRAIEDLNEITVHMLECMKFKLMGEARNKAPKNNPTGIHHQTNNDGGFQNNAGNLGMDSVQTQVWNLVEACIEPDGISIASIRAQLKGLNLNQIKKALDFLSNEGHIYSTIDEEHFRSTS
uniref:Replication protein A 32 kDa subunit-A-like n=1 Tax=Phallusia mammillata TaxID=59560 RepID=A0A6F9DR72_9ASCI|nr:replication protein A 32 kDa subunit-A-like [Phallusia mammillata]